MEAVEAHPWAVEAHPGAVEAPPGAVGLCAAKAHPAAMEAYSGAVKAPTGAMGANFMPWKISLSYPTPVTAWTEQMMTYDKFVFF